MRNPETMEIVIATAKGKVIVIDLANVPKRPRVDTGEMLMDVGPDDYIVAVAKVPRMPGT